MVAHNGVPGLEDKGLSVVVNALCVILVLGAAHRKTPSSRSLSVM